MLINEAARDLYDDEAPRWANLEAWVRTNSDKHLPELDAYFRRWHEIDKGRWLSDPNDIDSAYRDLEVAENRAHDQGYPLPPGHGKRTKTTTEIVNAGEGIHEASVRVQEATGLPVEVATSIADQEASSNNAAKIPILGQLTDPKDLSWCQRASVPDAICGKDGLHMPDDKTPIYLAVGAGALLLGGIAYAGYKTSKVVAPIALRYYAPELVPHYEAFREARQQGGSGEEHVLRMLDEIQGRSPSARPERRAHVRDAVEDYQRRQAGDSSEAPTLRRTLPPAGTTTTFERLKIGDKFRTVYTDAMGNVVRTGRDLFRKTEHDKYVDEDGDGHDADEPNMIVRRA